MSNSESGPTITAEQFAQLYNELRAMARGQMALERTDHTLQTTALVHEVFIRMFPSGMMDRKSFLIAPHRLGGAS